MESEDRSPLDISEFKCTSANKSAVVVVFAQTNRRYVYSWDGDELSIADPAIEGVPGPHAPEVIDCLARAVAYKVARENFGSQKPSGRFWQALPRASLIRGLLHMR